MGDVLTGTLSGVGTMTGSVAAGMVANKKTGTYTVTPETLATILRMAEPGATIKLSPGEYGRIDLHSKTAYPEDLTIIGLEGATVAGVSITSGVLSSDIIKEGNSNVENAVLPSGLTFRGVTFNKPFSLRNARVDDLTIEDCIFDGCNVFITPESFTDSYGSDKGSGNTSALRYPEAHLNQKNLMISNCTFNNAAGYQNAEKTSIGSGIHVIGVSNVTVNGNTITGALDEHGVAGVHDGIQVGGYNSSPYYVWGSGDIKVTMNKVTNCRSRGINITGIYNGDVTVAGNKLVNTNTAGKLSVDEIKPEAIIVRGSENVTINWTINGSLGNDFSKGFGNAWEDRKIVVGDGITVINSTSPAEYYKALTDADNKMEATIPAEYIYTGLYDEVEDKLNDWLDNTVLASMANNTIRNISIRVGNPDGKGYGIIPWPAMGTIHKRSNTLATIEVTTQVHGKRYTKYKNNTWKDTVCETDKLNNLETNAIVYDSGELNTSQFVTNGHSNHYLVDVKCCTSTDVFHKVFALDGASLLYSEQRDYEYEVVFNDAGEICVGSICLSITRWTKGSTIEVSGYGLLGPEDPIITRVTGYN